MRLATFDVFWILMNDRVWWVGKRVGEASTGEQKGRTEKETSHAVYQDRSPETMTPGTRVRVSA